MAAQSSTPASALPVHTGAVESSSTWRLTDRIGLAVCWLLGLAFCAVTVAIVAFLAVQGARYLSLSLLVTNQSSGVTQSTSGGFLDPLIGTVVVSVLGMLIAVPLGVTTAVWLSEYGRPFALARAVESTIDMIAGIPTVVLALFGLIIFESPLLGFASRSEGHSAYGHSYLAAGAMLSLIALPLIVGSTRAGLESIPSRVREASLAVGKTRIATIRRILLPTARPQVVTGAMLGLGRIIGDTAIIALLGTTTLALAGGTPLINLLRGSGATLTSFVFYNAPTGDGNQPQKAYAAAFVLLLMVLALNGIVEYVARRSKVAAWSS